MSKIFFFNVWRKRVFDIYFTEFGTPLTTSLYNYEFWLSLYKIVRSSVILLLPLLPILFQYCYQYCYSYSRNLWAVMKLGGFGTLKSDSTHHFFRNACTKSGSLRFSQFSGCWLILSVYVTMSFDFLFVRLFGVR
jgi:hypothetical protein